MCSVNVIVAFVFLFLGEVALNLNWSIVADMLLYIVIPTCRSTAEAVQILASHAFGDAGSPYLIGLISDGLYDYLSAGVTLCPADASVAYPSQNITVDPNEDLSMQILDTTTLARPEDCEPEVLYAYTSLQYAFFTNCAVEVVG